MSMRLYGACRSAGQCICGLCDKIRKKYSREAIEVNYRDAPDTLENRPVPGLKKELVCSYHTGKHRTSCWGYPAGQRHEIPAEVFEVTKTYLCPGGGLIDECEWTGSRWDYKMHWREKHAIIPNPIPLKTAPAR